jgi:hypothetical protein
LQYKKQFETCLPADYSLMISTNQGKHAVDPHMMNIEVAAARMQQFALAIDDESLV